MRHPVNRVEEFLVPFRSLSTPNWEAAIPIGDYGGAAKLGAAGTYSGSLRPENAAFIDDNEDNIAAFDKSGNFTTFLVRNNKLTKEQKNKLDMWFDRPGPKRMFFDLDSTLGEWRRGN